MLGQELVVSRMQATSSVSMEYGCPRVGDSSPCQSPGPVSGPGGHRLTLPASWDLAHPDLDLALHERPLGVLVCIAQAAQQRAEVVAALARKLEVGQEIPRGSGQRARVVEAAVDRARVLETDLEVAWHARAQECAPFVLRQRPPGGRLADRDQHGDGTGL